MAAKSRLFQIQIQNGSPSSTGEDWGTWNVLPHETVFEFRYQILYEQLAQADLTFGRGPGLLAHNKRRMNPRSATELSSL